MAPPILRSDRSRSFMQNRLSRCDNKVVAKVVIFRKTPTFAVLANGSAFGFFLFGTSRQNILCKHLQYLQMLCSYIFAAPYSQKSHTAARVAIFGSPVYRAYTNIDAANSPFLPKAAYLRSQRVNAARMLWRAIKKCAAEGCTLKITKNDLSAQIIFREHKYLFAQGKSQFSAAHPNLATLCLTGRG